MGKLRRKLLTTTMIPAVVGLGSVMAFDASACMCQRKAAAKTYTMALENPEAVADPATGLAAGCGGCGGCGGGCGGCGAGCGACGGCGACNPCASECEEDPCNPCAVCDDPCGASLETATGLAAGCGGCGGCGGGCGGCGAGCGACGGCGACNPCASECEEDPCNPCAVCEDPCGASLETATGLAAGCGGCGGCGGGCGGCGAGCGACGGCGACNPCASECEEDPCNPCAVCEDPCGASLETATGLAAGCGGCGGCGGGCGGCGAGCGACGGCGACNPCASECEEDPCNPCAVCEDPCGASLWQPDDGTDVAWNVLTGEPSADYGAGMLPWGDVPASVDGSFEHVAGLADEGIGAVGSGSADPGSRFVPGETVSDNGNWRYTLSTS